MPSITVLKDTCKGCYLCVPACKPNVLFEQAREINKQGYFAVEYRDPDHRCTGCKACAQVCPDVAIRVYR